MPEPRFRDFLAASFHALEGESPEVYQRLCRHFAPREVGITVDGDTVGLLFHARRVRLQGEITRPSIAVTTDGPTILALVDARATLVDAIWNDRLALCGSPADLLVFHDGLMIYLHGAVRSPAFPGLLRAYRATAAESERGVTTDPRHG